MVHDPRIWTHQYRICGIAGLVVFVIALVGLRELSPRLRDQLMVTMRDRALIEARAKGIDIEAALRHPWRQLLKPDVIISAIGVSLMLLIYYTAVAFAVIYLTTVFGFSVKDANGLGNWNWGFNVIAVILIGIISDRFRVRKPFMVIGGVVAAVMTVVYLDAGGPPSRATTRSPSSWPCARSSWAWPTAPGWPAITETVEARNPGAHRHRPGHLGLDHPGRGLRRVPDHPGRDQLGHAPGQLRAHRVRVRGPATSSELTFAQTHPQVVATATKYKTQLANAQKFAPELAVIQANPALFAKLATYPNPAAIPPKLAAQAVAAAGRGRQGDSPSCPPSAPTAPPSRASSPWPPSWPRWRRTRPS